MSIENGMFRLNDVVLSFPTLVKPKAFAPGQVEKYSADFIMKPDDPQFEEFKAFGVTMAKEKFADKADGILKMIADNRKLRCFGNGNDRVKVADGSVYAGYEGNMFIGANSTDKPDLYDESGAVLMNAAKLTGGSIVNAYIRPWIQDNSFGKAIRCEVVAVQFVKAGESFGATRPDTSAMFGKVDGAPDATDKNFQF